MNHSTKSNMYVNLLWRRPLVWGLTFWSLDFGCLVVSILFVFLEQGITIFGQDDGAR